MTAEEGETLRRLLMAFLDEHVATVGAQAYVRLARLESTCPVSPDTGTGLVSFTPEELGRYEQDLRADAIAQTFVSLREALDDIP